VQNNNAQTTPSLRNSSGADLKVKPMLDRRFARGGKMNLNRCLFFPLILFYCFLFSCVNQTKVIDSKTLLPKDINMTINKNTINFVDSKIDNFIKLIGASASKEVVGGNELGTIEKRVFNGLNIEYYSESGILRSINIESTNYSIVNNIKIGNNKAEVLKILHNGLFYPEINCYIFYAENTEKDGGPGYEIYFNKKDKVVKISICYITFGI